MDGVKKVSQKGREGQWKRDINKWKDNDRMDRVMKMSQKDRGGR